MNSQFIAAGCVRWDSYRAGWDLCFVQLFMSVLCKTFPKAFLGLTACVEPWGSSIPSPTEDGVHLWECSPGSDVHLQGWSLGRDDHLQGWSLGRNVYPQGWSLGSCCPLCVPGHSWILSGLWLSLQCPLAGGCRWTGSLC